MADYRSRLLEREAAKGEPLTRPRLLVDRLRRGELTERRLALAAYCGDRDALAALPERVLRWKDGYLCCCGDIDRDHDCTIDGYTHSPVHVCTYTGPNSPPNEDLPCDCALTEREERRPAVVPPTEFRKWVTGLVRWDDMTYTSLMLRASVVSAQLVLRCEREERGNPHADGSGCPGGNLCSDLCAARDAIYAAEAWLECPCAEHLQKWHVSFVSGRNDRAGWVPMPEPTPSRIREGELRHAAQRIHEETVRREVSAALITLALARPEMRSGRVG